jgi:AhpD family alkylhydroperoxidase
MGRIPAIYATMAHSPTTLEAMLNYNEGLKKGSLSSKEIEAISLAVGQTNNCDYCVAAHTVLGKMAGLSVEETLECRKGKVHDLKLDSLVKLAIEIVKTRGLPSAKTVADFYAAGYSDSALIEVIAWTTYDIFTNYFNHIAETVSDFPQAPALA